MTWIPTYSGCFFLRISDFILLLHTLSEELHTYGPESSHNCTTKYLLAQMTHNANTVRSFVRGLVSANAIVRLSFVNYVCLPICCILVCCVNYV